jgi:nucleoside-diphosphate-sugar epimerase
VAPRTVLLTGASGVVGRAVRAALRRHRVISLAHSQRIPDRPQVRGDVSLADLGLGPDRYRQLADEVDTVVHCAAVTDFTADDTQIHRANAEGTAHVVRFAERAGATLHHVSTAFVARSDAVSGAAEEAKADPGPYLDSKVTGEAAVREAGTPGTIVRPSIVIGDSHTGTIEKFQGLHALALAVLRNALPLLPLNPDSRIDFVPRDLVGRAVAALVEAGATAGEYWVCAGEHALTAGHLLDLTVQTGTRMGMELTPPRLVEPDMVTRLVRPVFVAPLPPTVRRRFDDMVAMTALFAAPRTFASNIDAIPGLAAPTSHELTDAYARGIGYLIKAKGLAPAPEGVA